MSDHAPWPPRWFDPDRSALLTPRNVHALAHPIRMAILRLLRDDGPATASALAERLGHSSGVTSYHLRMLADAELVAEDETLGNRRDRWWRAAQENVVFSFRVPGEEGDVGQLEAAEQYLRMTAQVGYERVLAYLETLSARGAEVAELPWHLISVDLDLTHAEARELAERMMETVAAFRRDHVGRARGRGGPDEQAPEGEQRHRAVFQVQLVPDEQAVPEVGR